MCSFIHSFIENKISPDNWEVIASFFFTSSFKFMDNLKISHMIIMITTATICPKSCLCLSVPLPTRLDVLVLILIILIEHLMYNVQCQVECTELCPCRTLQQRARADRFKLSFLIVVKENLVVMIGTYSHWRPIHSTCG